MSNHAAAYAKITGKDVKLTPEEAAQELAEQTHKQAEDVLLKQELVKWLEHPITKKLLGEMRATSESLKASAATLSHNVCSTTQDQEQNTLRILKLLTCSETIRKEVDSIYARTRHNA